MSEAEQGGTGDDSTAVAEFALGLLDGGERAAVARRIAGDMALRAELAFWQSRLAALDAEYDEVAPPAALAGRIEARLFGSGRSARWWDSLLLWRVVAAGGLAVAVVVTGLYLAAPRYTPADLATQLVAALREEGSSVSLVALYDPASGTLRLTGLSGAAVPERDYELWAIEGANAPVSLGVIAVSGRTERAVPSAILPAFGEGTVLAVSLEPKGGSKTGGPTGPIVAKGAAAPI